MAAEILFGASIILRGLSSSKTNLRALSTGGLYLSVSSEEKIRFLYHLKKMFKILCF